MLQKIPNTPKDKLYTLSPDEYKKHHGGNGNEPPKPGGGKHTISSENPNVTGHAAIAVANERTSDGNANSETCQERNDRDTGSSSGTKPRQKTPPDPVPNKQDSGNENTDDHDPGPTAGPTRSQQKMPSDPEPKLQSPVKENAWLIALAQVIDFPSAEGVSTVLKDTFSVGMRGVDQIHMRSNKALTLEEFNMRFKSDSDCTEYLAAFAGRMDSFARNAVENVVGT